MIAVQLKLVIEPLYFKCIYVIYFILQLTPYLKEVLLLII